VRGSGPIPSSCILLKNLELLEINAKIYFRIARGCALFTGWLGVPIWRSTILYFRENSISYWRKYSFGHETVFLWWCKPNSSIASLSARDGEYCEGWTVGVGPIQRKLTVTLAIFSGGALLVKSRVLGFKTTSQLLKTHVVPLDQIKSANLHIEWTWLQTILYGYMVGLGVTGFYCWPHTCNVTVRDEDGNARLWLSWYTA
jgi:hypothetical protein